MQVRGSVKRAAQVAVREHAEQVHGVIDDGRHAEALGGNLQQALGQGGAGPNRRNVRAGAHHVPDV